MHNSNTFGIHFILRNEREKEGKSPVYLRIVVNKTRSEIALKMLVAKSDWNIQKGFVKPKTQELKKINNHLEEVRAKVVNCYWQLEKENEVITAEGLKNAYLGKRQNNYKFTLCMLIEMHNKQMKEVLKPGTMKNYYTTEKYLKNFLQERFNSADVFLAKLDFKFITDFEYYLRKNPLKKEDPCTTNGVMKHLERLKKLITWAVNLKLINENLVESYKLKFQTFERGYLEMRELNRIEALALSNKQQDFVRDLFIFGCYTGLSYCDVINLKNTNIEIDIDGRKWINTLRLKAKLTQKNVVPVYVPLLKSANTIIEKYKDDPRVCNTDNLFPSVSNQELNRNLKIIAGISGIDKNITFHLARHTFATTITLNNGVPIESVSKMLGHTKISTTQIYAKVMRKKLAEEMGTLQEKLLLRRE